MKYKNINSGTHPIHQDILPILSALKLGNRRIAKYRLDTLITRLDLVYWEQLVVANMINKKRENDSQARVAKNNAEHWARLRRDYPAIERKA
jgi:hypothetical protein